MSRSPYKQGFYTPINPKKYTGTLPIVYRSGLELTALRWCDRNDNILTYGSESVVLPYVSPKDGKIHRYFVDLVLKMKTNDGIKKYLVEIKPSSQVDPPSPAGKKKKSTILYEQIMWAVNSKKWESARKWCEKNGYTFVVLTEKDLQ